MSPARKNALVALLFQLVAACSRSVSLEKQLARLAELGVVQNQGTLPEDLFAFHTREELERKPYRGLAEALAMDIEREPWTPLADRLWMCDFERIEDTGDYRSVVLRLERMTGSALALANVADHVDLEQETAWVEFDHRGQHVHWDLLVKDDWLDPVILERYDGLLRSSGAKLRLHGNFSDYGQAALLAAFEPGQSEAFRALTGIALHPVDEAER